MPDDFTGLLMVSPTLAFAQLRACLKEYAADHMDGLGSSDPSDFYERKYLIKGSHNPALVFFSSFALLALHYALSDTLFKAVAHPNKIIRTFHRRAYYSSARFVLGSALSLLTGGRRKP